MKVNLFICGFSKCGTTSLYNLLRSSNSIGIGTTKEPGFFSKMPGYHTTSNPNHWTLGGNYERGYAWYNKVFKKANNNAKYWLDASTQYGFDPVSPKLIYQYNPKSKIIFIVRTPFDRIESHYFQEFKSGRNLPPFKNFIQSDHPRLNFYKKVTRYKDVINRYVQYFGKDEIFVTSLNSLKENPQNTINKLSSYLDLDKITYSVGNKHANKRKKSRSRILKRILLILERSKFAQKMPRFIQEIGSNLMRGIDNLLLTELKESENPNINLNIKKDINKQFIDDMEYLREEFNINLLNY